MSNFGSLNINAQNLQVGDGNTMHVQTQQILQQWYDKIDASDAPAEQKAEAKGWIQKGLESPILAALLGAVATAGFEAAKRP